MNFWKNNIPVGFTETLTYSSKHIFKCEFCNNYFDNFRKLGGHMSNQHPKSSAYYSYRKEVRDKRYLERVAYKMALEKYN